MTETTDRRPATGPAILDTAMQTLSIAQAIQERLEAHIAASAERQADLNMRLSQIEAREAALAKRLTQLAVAVGELPRNLHAAAALDEASGHENTTQQER